MPPEVEWFGRHAQSGSSCHAALRTTSPGVLLTFLSEEAQTGQEEKSRMPAGCRLGAGSAIDTNSETYTLGTFSSPPGPSNRKIMKECQRSQAPNRKII